jgi:phthiodiolone/phenolphthiodiolone dimycocerosates ketoreductase
MSGMRVGLMDAPAHCRYYPPAVIRAGYLMALAAGADSFWMPDHLNSFWPRSIVTPKYVGGARLVPNSDALYEPWTVLGNLAARNRVGRLSLGVGVTDAGRRNPAVTAQAAVTLHHLNRGGAILGIGTGEREANEQYGVDWSRPVARFEEALATIRALWDSNGELVCRDSPFFPLHNASFALPPARGGWPEIWIASHGPRMLRATGRYGDAWFPAFPGQTPQEYAAKLDVIRSVASDAGRDPSAITPALWMACVTGRSRGEVDEAMDSATLRWWALAAPDAVWQRHGAEHPMGPGFTGAQDLVPQTIDEATAVSYARKVPRSLLGECVLHGTPREVVEQAATWRDHGVRYLVLGNFSSVHPSLRTGLAAAVPYVRLARGIKRL